MSRSKSSALVRLRPKQFKKKTPPLTSFFHIRDVSVAFSLAFDEIHTPLLLQKESEVMAGLHHLITCSVWMLDRNQKRKRKGKKQMFFFLFLAALEVTVPASSFKK